MSLRVRGQEVTIKLTIDGDPQNGSWLKIKDFKLRPKTEFKEEDYLGESEEDYDIQHSGYELSFNVDNEDDKTIRYLQTLAEREAAGLSPQRVTMTVIYAYRQRAKVTADNFYDVLLIVDEHGAGGRKEYVGTSFSGRCKKKNVIQAA